MGVSHSKQIHGTVFILSGIHQFWDELTKRDMEDEEALDFLKHFCWLVKSDDGELFVRHGSYHHRTYLIESEKEAFKSYMLEEMMVEDH